MWASIGLGWTRVKRRAWWVGFLVGLGVGFAVGLAILPPLLAAWGL